MNRITARLKEPSTWASIAAMSAGIPLPPWNWAAVFIAGTIGILLREKSTPTEPTAK